jgi:hypothetical protein
MKLKGLFAFEIALVAVVIIVIMVFVEVTPYLVSSKQNDQIGVFSQKEFTKNTVSLLTGQKTSSRFNYSTFDPAILVVDLSFRSWENPGYLSLYCNGILIVTIEATERNPEVQLTTITLSGYDLVKPHYQLSQVFSTYTYGNEISFVSPVENGYEGTFSYKISVRGSR